MKLERDHISHAIVTAAMAGALVVAALPTHASAAERAPCATQRTLDARLAAQVDRGPAALRGFVIRTRNVYALDMNEAVERVATHRTACGAK